MKLIKQYRFTLITLGVLFILFFINRTLSENAISLSLKSAFTMLGILPPILLIVNLMDTWVPREIIVHHMGEDAGARGFFWAFALGTLGAGPLYAAFPVAAFLAKKGARMAYIIFLLGIWTSTKLPISMYELNFFGGVFTLVHICTGILVYLILAIIMEKILNAQQRKEVYSRLARHSK